MTTIGIGVIGMGWMGEVHSRSYRQVLDRFYDSGIRPRLILCSDNVEERAKRAQERLGFEGYTTNWYDVINHPEIQVVNVATPNGLHLEMIEAATAAGKHVFCEKPVGRDPQQTALAEKATREAGVQSFVGFNYRWTPVVQYIKQLIDDGTLGQLTHYRGRFFACYASDPNSVLSWRFQRDNGLGTLGDLMPHVIDMAHMLMGPIERIVGNKTTFIKTRPIAQPGKGTHFSTGSPDDPQGDVTNEDYVGALVSFTNGVQGTLEGCRAINGPKCEMAFELNGTKGSVKWNFERMNEVELQLRNADNAQDGFTTIFGAPEHPAHGNFNPGPAIGMGYEDLKAIEAYQFLQGIVNGQQNEPSFEQALAVADVQTAIEKSWESERWEVVISTRV